MTSEQEKTKIRAKVKLVVTGPDGKVKIKEEGKRLTYKEYIQNLLKKKESK